MRSALGWLWCYGYPVTTASTAAPLPEAMRAVLDVLVDTHGDRPARRMVTTEALHTCGNTSMTKTVLPSTQIRAPRHNATTSSRARHRPVVTANGQRPASTEAARPPTRC